MDCVSRINNVYNIDSRSIESILPNECLIQTTITSPPYFDMKDYGVNNQIGFGQTYDKYLDDLQSIFKTILKKTKLYHGHLTALFKEKLSIFFFSLKEQNLNITRMLQEYMIHKY